MEATAGAVTGKLSQVMRCRQLRMVLYLCLENMAIVLFLRQMHAPA